jgi:hypothetical protein
MSPPKNPETNTTMSLPLNHPVNRLLSLTEQPHAQKISLFKDHRGIILDGHDLNCSGRSSVSDQLGFPTTNALGNWVEDNHPGGFEGWLLDTPSPGKPVIQEWVWGLPLMQQTVLLTAIRGPDGIAKYGPTKLVLRWFRRCILLSAMDGKVLDNPYDNNGGSFTGPSIETPTGLNEWEAAMDRAATDYLAQTDGLPHHFILHLMHASEILGYKHPDERIRTWWYRFYERQVHAMHLWVETEQELDKRLGDCRDGWLERADPATVA